MEIKFSDLNKILIFLFCFALLQGRAYSNITDKYNEVIEAYRADDYVTARKKGVALLPEVKESQDLYHLTKLYYLLGYMCEYTEDFGNSIIYYLEGARHGILADDDRLTNNIISIHKNLSLLLAEYKHYDLAHRFLDEGLKFARESNNESQTIALLNNRVFLLLDEEKFEQAITEISELRTKYEIDASRNVILQNKLGWAQYSLGFYEDALHSFYNVVEDSASLGLEVYSISLRNIAIIYRERNDLTNSIETLKKAISYNIENNFNRWLLRSYSTIGEIYLVKQEPRVALEYFSKGMELVDHGDQNSQSYEIYKLASQAYGEFGNLEKALTLKELYATHLEEYIAQQNEISELGQLYNIQLLTDRYYDLLAADMEQKRTEKLAKFGIGGTASFFLIILSVVVYRQKRMKITLARELHELELHSEV
ncbi:MAG: hypothetical protein CMB80_17170 [Flammeovirgaceae bacterium]|nr:hypothetical protein [Flammeovirgaceae bacterium]